MLIWFTLLKYKVVCANQASKMNYFWCQGILFTWTLISKMDLSIITKNHAADPEIGFLSKSISKPNGCATAMPTAWEVFYTNAVAEDSTIGYFPNIHRKNAENLTIVLFWPFCYQTVYTLLECLREREADYQTERFACHKYTVYYIQECFTFLNK